MLDQTIDRNQTEEKETAAPSMYYSMRSNCIIVFPLVVLHHNRCLVFLFKPLHFYAIKAKLKINK